MSIRKEIKMDWLNAVKTNGLLFYVVWGIVILLTIFSIITMVRRQLGDFEATVPGQYLVEVASYVNFEDAEINITSEKLFTFDVQEQIVQAQKIGEKNFFAQGYALSGQAYIDAVLEIELLDGSFVSSPTPAGKIFFSIWFVPFTILFIGFVIIVMPLLWASCLEIKPISSKDS